MTPEERQRYINEMKAKGWDDATIASVIKSLEKQASTVVKPARPVWEHNPNVISILLKRLQDKIEELRRLLADALTFGFTPTRNDAALLAGAEDIAMNVAGTLIGEAAMLGAPRLLAALMGRTNTGRALYLNRALNSAVEGTPSYITFMEESSPIVRTASLPVYTTIRKGDNLSLLLRSSKLISEAESLGIPKEARPRFHTHAENSEFAAQANAFAKKFGYPEIKYGPGISTLELERLVRDMLSRHNTYSRGVSTPINVDSRSIFEKFINSPVDYKTLYLDLVKKALGKENPSVEELLQYVATHGYELDPNKLIWIGPRQNTGIYSGYDWTKGPIEGAKLGRATIVQRKYSLGPDRTKWFEEADFPIYAQTNPKGVYGNPDLGNTPRMQVPWTHTGTSQTVENEITSLNQDLIFRDFWPLVESTGVDVEGKPWNYWSEEFIPERFSLNNKVRDPRFGTYSPGAYKKGGRIHIKPENKGKFTETKKRTGKTTEELTHSKNPLTRKRAIFALNAKKWKH